MVNGGNARCLCGTTGLGRRPRIQPSDLAFDCGTENIRVDRADRGQLLALDEFGET